MSCKEVQSRLQSFLDGDLNEKAMRRVHSHLERCPECAALKRDFELLTRLAKNEVPVRAPEDFEGRLRTRLDARGRRRRPWGWHPTPLAWGAATAVVAVLLVSSVFFSGHNRQAKLPSSLPISEARVSPVILPADAGIPHTHVIIPDDEDNVLVGIPSTVTITRQQLTHDFFLSEVSH